MIAIDTNVLVYAHREELPQHEVALAALTAVVTGPAPYGVPWPCAVEFIRVVTHARLFRPASTVEQALAALRSVIAPDRGRLLLPVAGSLDGLEEVLLAARATGNLVFHAQIATICAACGAELLTADRDFVRFPGLRVRYLTTRAGPTVPPAPG